MSIEGTAPPPWPATPEVLRQAEVAAERAADRSGVRIVVLGSVAELESVRILVNETWPAEVSISLLRALRKADNLVSGAYRDGMLVGACIGFFGAAGRVELHSHLAVIDRRHRASGVGTVLKLHQRAWALERGVSRICWTYDPLERRNAYLNLTKLAADPVEYLVNFYGDHGDGLEGPFPTDRLMVAWDLASAAVIAAAERRPTVPDLADLRVAGSATVLAMDARGAPKEGRDHGEPFLLVGTPQDAGLLRAHDPALALEWRLRVRHQLSQALESGARVTGFAPEGFYVLQRRG